MAVNKLHPSLRERARKLNEELRAAQRHAKSGELTGQAYDERCKELYDQAVALRDEDVALKEQGDGDDLRSTLKNLLGSDPSPAHRAGRGERWAKAIVDFHARAVGPHAKDGLVPSGSVVVALPAPPVISDTIPVRRMRQLLRTDDAPGGHYRYLEQTIREWNAAEVAVGEEKPESPVGLELREGQAPVVATVSEPLDRFMLSDAPALAQFVGTELQEAVEAAIEAAALGELAEADLAQVAFVSDALTTVRRAIGQLENRGVNATGIITHPDTWTEVETSRDEVNQFLLSPAGAPLNAVTRRAWSVPVVTTVACPHGTAYVGDWGTYARFFSPDRGMVRLDWSEAVADDFRRNQIRFRAETRNKLALLLTPAFVEVALDGEGVTPGSASITPAKARAPQAKRNVETK